MKNELNSNLILKVYEHIRQQGQEYEEGKQFEGITAFSDPDGYTIYLKGSGVFLRFGFHNTYQFNYDKESQKADFMKKVHYIASMLDD
ncbi:DUF3081 domain-containing protein [Pseudoalteromonas luteoviolacea]|uniref:DUF3081 domain-containing protein n=1 Tax=Pseudoalteromonas luteoviolacea H33 TaxID=1365251 RepID=A0A167B7U0_9GAMM|nr:DUF3081 domain-containing protein [Pseudoalteromonas luteoviolacea]KZN46235.1 hypothetical protein N476_03670 [Pseudoalteromonas luteoviolacea H33]KZN75110.1 hypothetical protein N477_19725 [Pseudoalteromonas luteoviolacea H33-S]MBQ4875873.1 DUF3081 domain-containing protein [Pseudoalteromonas luteoviolacea]MBQ4904908.1 DUF3081 domain-containing protein [Pseudoalteromonas luteoviolacea]